MDPIPPSNLPATPDLTFQVMPQDLNHPEKYVSSAPMPPPPPRPPSGEIHSGVGPAPRPNAPLPPRPPLPGNDPMLNLDPPPGNRRNLLMVIGAIVLIVLIGAGLYYFLGGKKTTETQQPAVTTRLPKVWLQQYFAQNLSSDGACNDPSICGDAVDPDSDGLNNYDEFKTGTSPIDADTDKDGLADGDEVNVYKTEPTLKYTDRRDIVSQNNWVDSYQIRNGYDPLTPGKKFTDSRLQQIQSDTATYPLHEPTLTSLSSAGTPVPPNPASQTGVKSVTVTIQNNQFSPASITINKGDSVVWLNKDSVAHHITSTVAGLESPDLTQGQTFSYTFTASGSFNYHCKIHPAMTGVVVVQ